MHVNVCSAILRNEKRDIFLSPVSVIRSADFISMSGKNCTLGTVASFQNSGTSNFLRMIGACVPHAKFSNSSE